MIAYNKIWLRNMFVRQEVTEAYEEHCVTEEELANIKKTYPVGYYTPDIFIGIGLFILTVIIALFTFGLVTLLFMSAMDHYSGTFTIILASITFTVLEYIINIKKHYRSGVDDALLWVAALTLFTGTCFLQNAGNLHMAAVALAISLICALRYADAVMALVAFVSLLSLLFFLGPWMGTMLISTMLFLLMIVSLVVYLGVKRTNKRNLFNVYSRCLVILEIASLVSIYGVVNYGIVKKFLNPMSGLLFPTSQSIPFGYTYWVLSILIPFVYLAYGIRKKDKVMIRVGMFFIAAMVFTIRYYHALLTPEIAMVLAGLLMIAFAWMLTRYLRVPKYGFTAAETDKKHFLDKLQLESLLIVETLAPQPAPIEGNNYGGGSFGGAGASGDF